MLVGDFDGDTNADLFVLSSVGIGNGNNGSATPHILYGDGKFGFQDTKPIASTDEVIYRVGDLNSDGRSDLYMMGTGGLHTYYGQGNRTLASYVQSTIYGGDFSPMSMADFNDDGRNDLVAIDSNYTSTFLVFFLAGANPGEFEYQTWNIPNAQFVSVDATGTQSYPVVGDFNRDGKPDWAYMGHTASNGGTSIAYTGLNSTENGLWSDCDYPHTQRGINLCSPALIAGSTVNFDATAHSLGDLRKIELWVDGKKLGEQYHTWEGNGFFNLTRILMRERTTGPTSLPALTILCCNITSRSAFLPVAVRHQQRESTYAGQRTERTLTQRQFSWMQPRT